MNRFTRLIRSPIAILAILGLAFALRMFRASEWSLWEDEETSLYFSQHPGEPFASYFPIFFGLLHKLFSMTDVSVEWGRLVATAFGLLSIWLTYSLGRRWSSQSVGLVAAAFVTINLGHVFWSQSVRYYTLVLVFQLLCMHWLLDGLERHDYRKLLLANLAFSLAMLTHFSTIILAPVLIVYLVLSALMQRKEGSLRLGSYAVFGVPFLLLLGFFAWRFLEFSKLNLINNENFMPLAGQDVLGIGMRVAGYFGVPVLLLGLLAVFVADNLPRRILLFLLLASLLPLLELAVIAQLRLAIVAWYYAFFALPTLAVLAAATVVSLYRRSYRMTSAALTCATVAYAAFFLAGYYTWMHGDRPRWREGTLLLQSAGVNTSAPKTQEIFATVPGVVAFYLGVPPDATLGNALVKRPPKHPPGTGAQVDRWFVVEAGVVSEEYARWFGTHCELLGRFEARTWTKDRSILVYHRGVD
jgi:uncharacterized membrane protein